MSMAVGLDPAYADAPAGQVRELLADKHPVVELVDRAPVERFAATPDASGRRHLEQTLSLTTWLNLYQPDIRLNGRSC
jgi:asparagine synthase (glutamine-hydrolysing)